MVMTLLLIITMCRGFDLKWNYFLFHKLRHCSFLIVNKYYFVNMVWKLPQVPPMKNISNTVYINGVPGN